MVSPEGDIISMENEILLSGEDASQSNALLISIASKVMQAQLKF